MTDMNSSNHIVRDRSLKNDVFFILMVAGAGKINKIYRSLEPIFVDWFY